MAQGSGLRSAKSRWQRMPLHSDWPSTFLNRPDRTEHHIVPMRDVVLTTVRLAARIFSLLAVGVFLSLAVEELSYPTPSQLTSVEWATIWLLITACLTLILAWRWEWLALLSVLSLGAVAFMTEWNPMLHVVLLLMTLPGILYIFDWLEQQISGHHQLSHHG